MNKKRTVKQIQAQRRAEIIMQLTGMRINLYRLKGYCRSYYLKSILQVAINAVNEALKRFQNLPQETENNPDRITWHSMFNSD